MNSRWSVEEEKMLINDIKNNKSFQELSLKYNRSPNALELRIKKIIYDNISANKSVKLIGGHLNLPEDKIMQYYYSYKEMLEKKGQPVNNLEKTNNIPVKNIKKIDGGNNLSVKQNGGINRDNESKSTIDNIKEQNDVFEEILKNVRSRQKLLKLLKDNKLDANMKLLLKDMLA